MSIKNIRVHASGRGKTGYYDISFLIPPPSPWQRNPLLNLDKKIWIFKEINTEDSLSGTTVKLYFQDNIVYC